MNIGIAQLNTIVGDVQGNMAKAKSALEELKIQGAEIAVFPELFTTGYPPRDLLFRKNLIEDNLNAKAELIALSKTTDLTIVFGFVEPNKNDGQKKFFNAVCVARNGESILIHHKTTLPTYDVFSEDRYFQPGVKDFPVFEHNGTPIGLIICEEAWNDETYWNERLYSVDPVVESVANGAEYIIAINASPYRMGILKQRIEIIRSHCTRHAIGFCYVNQVGYNDDVGFDGNSFAMNKNGQVIHKSIFAKEEVMAFSTDQMPVPENTIEMPLEEEIVHMLTMGIRDYFGKLGIAGPAIIGLSGGIDSALTAFLAVNALGKDRIIGIAMPSEFSSKGSVNDAEKIAKKLGIHFAETSIYEEHDCIRWSVNQTNRQILSGKYGPTSDTQENQDLAESNELFGKKFVNCENAGLTDENIQARIRGIYLMAQANYYNGIVLTTGNKSEIAMGYFTIYGDSCGGLAPLSDLYKSKVFDVCRWINSTYRDEIIPEATINKPPSAELRKDQKDQDTLPPYEILDEILVQFVEGAKTADEIVEQFGYDKSMKYRRDTGRNLTEDIYWVCQTVVKNEFKRKQGATGLKLTGKLFRYGWDMPLAHKLPTRGVFKSGADSSFGE